MSGGRQARGHSLKSSFEIATIAAKCARFAWSAQRAQSL